MQGDLNAALTHNYQRWLGQPVERLVPPSRHASFSPDFQVLVFQRPAHAVLASVGASHQPAPGSLGRSPGTGGVRQEYLLHAPLIEPVAWANALMGLAALPFVNGRPLMAGASLPLGDPALLPGTRFSHVYLSLPVQDDPGVFGEAAQGALRGPGVYVETLWIVPLYPEEQAALAAGRRAELDRALRQPAFKAADPARPSVFPPDGSQA